MTIVQRLEEALSKCDYFVELKGERGLDSCALAADYVNAAALESQGIFRCMIRILCKTIGHVKRARM